MIKQLIFHILLKCVVHIVNNVIPAVCFLFPLKTTPYTKEVTPLTKYALHKYTTDLKQQPQSYIYNHIIHYVAT